ncbi:MAG TPA: helix-turn-helix domain-containing protein [Candidatus Acidoferrales bacterium]|nr:helix-turn-helix domain-containing protein [Candidatus Acidoferrales bacterium]
MKDQLESLVSQMVSRGILLAEAVEEFEKRFIKAAMDGANGNQSRAARTLGIHRNTLSRKIEKFRLDRRAARHR